jgi:trans-aconitate methyltransferase
VERRHKVEAGATLDSAGKRAACALFYGPLHAICVAHVVDALHARTPRAVIDLGCGTGAAGAAWALGRDESGREPAAVITGIDRNRWAVDEARWTYRMLGLTGSARVGDLRRLPPPGSDAGVIAAYVLNELPDMLRESVVHRLADASGRGTSVLIIEPIARSITPWWEETAHRFEEHGGRADEWRFSVVLPSLVEKFARAAGLRHHEIKCRTISVNISGQR